MEIEERVSIDQPGDPDEIWSPAVGSSPAVGWVSQSNIAVLAASWEARRRSNVGMCPLGD